MFAYLSGRLAADDVCAALVRTAALAAMLALAGCASNSNYAAAVAPRVAQAAVTVIEDDGLPAQAPPPARIRDVPDDPSEPFSRNYGGANPSASTNSGPAASPPAPANAPKPLLPDDLPPAFRQKLLAAANDEN